MKTNFLILLLSLITITSLAQEKEHYIKDDIFYTTLESGVGEKVPVKFKLGLQFQSKINEIELFKKWEIETFSNPKNEKYIERWKNQSKVETYLMDLTSSASFYAKLDVKNGNSYTPIKDSEGFIYINDKGELNISFPIKAQNGYGNMVFAKAFYIVSLNDGKNSVSHFISTN